MTSIARITGVVVAVLLVQMAIAGDLLDPAHTPGAADLAVTQEKIRQTIFVSGYTVCGYTDIAKARNK